MSEENQIVVPESFVGLHVPQGRSRAKPAWAEIAQRYEFCEDLAQMLVEQARTKLWELGVTEGDVLERVQLGLLAQGAPTTAAEAGWVVRRLAELLDWAMPEPRASRQAKDGS